MLNLIEPSAVMQENREIEFYYVNWKGLSALRTAIPLVLWFGSTEWHPREQWFIKAFDVEKGEERDFAVADMEFLQKHSRQLQFQSC